MEPLKPRDKVTQHMTRDGLTLDNQTTGESVNVSSREAEQEYTAQPEGAAEKILERADELHDRHKAKKAAKDAGETVAQATGPVSRLQFTAEERASPELAPYIKKAEKRADKLEAAKEALPKKRVVTKETVYDEAKGKAKSRLYFDKVEKAPPQLKPNPASRPIQEAGLYLHGKIHEVEHENVGVEGGHKGEELAERQAGRMIRSGVHRHKLKPYRAAAKAERKSIAANAEFAYQKSLRDNPELAQAAKNRPALERGADRRRRGPHAPAGDGRPAILHRHVWQHRDGPCRHLLSLRGQRYAGSRSRLCRAGSRLAARTWQLRKPAPRL